MANLKLNNYESTLLELTLCNLDFGKFREGYIEMGELNKEIANDFLYAENEASEINELFLGDDDE